MQRPHDGAADTWPDKHIIGPVIPMLVEPRAVYRPVSLRGTEVGNEGGGDVPPTSHVHQGGDICTIMSSHFDRSDALRGVGRVAEAANEMRQALLISPTVASGYLDLAEMLELLSSYQDRSITESVAMRVQSDGMVREVSVLAAEAEYAYRVGIRLGPADSSAYYQLASMLRARDRLTEALSLFEKAQQLDPEQAAVTSSLAYLLISTLSLSQQRRGLQLLGNGMAAGLWPLRGVWQHPAEFLPVVAMPPSLFGLHERHTYACVLDHLEAFAADMGNEA